MVTHRLVIWLTVRTLVASDEGVTSTHCGVGRICVVMNEVCGMNCKMLVVMYFVMGGVVERGLVVGGVIERGFVVGGVVERGPVVGGVVTGIGVICQVGKVGVVLLLLLLLRGPTMLLCWVICG